MLHSKKERIINKLPFNFGFKFQKYCWVQKKNKEDAITIAHDHSLNICTFLNLNRKIMRRKKKNRFLF